MKFTFVEFSVKNYKIFKDKATLSTVVNSSGKTKKKFLYSIKNDHFLKTILIYGSNASGKSTLIEGLQYFTYLIKKSESIGLSEELNYNPFRLEVNNKEKPTMFELTFGLDNDFYSYKIEYKKNKIIFEELKEIGNDRSLFKRTKSDISKSGFEKHSTFRVAQDIKNSTLENVLILTRSASTGTKLSKEIVTTLNDNLKIINKISISTTANLILKESSFKNKIIEHLKRADRDIADINIEKREIEEEFREKHSIPSAAKFLFKIGISHNIRDDKNNIIKASNIALWEESKGTEIFFGLLGPIVDALEGGKSLFIDEFSENLHPYITQYIISLFNNTKTNPNNAQLITTTHDTSLLNGELILENFRFTEKTKYSDAQLYSLTDFVSGDIRKLRNDQKYAEKYLEGRFGAVPFIDWGGNG